ncbi:MAG: FAD-binding oxidoreductase [Gemmatimonadaceae bacterium]|nr:FAD-binding oxidoreductase [Gemmatimonadaceae bacterium]MCC6429881.1 FAD-binding oxidoreductase [Gemmatimonadaceae bacterium]
MTGTSEVVICGAGIAGIAAAHALAVTHGVRNIVLVDERPPLTLTSDKSTEAYRNWWPGPDDAMVRFMNRSIDLLEQWADASGNRFLLNRRGYLYATASHNRADGFLQDARVAALQGAGDVRIYRDVQDAAAYQPSAHVGFHGHPTGADLFLDRAVIAAHFPWLADDIVAVLHARRCGWMSGQQLGMYLLDEARAAGVTVLSGQVQRVQVTSGRVAAVTVAGADGVTHEIATRTFVNCAGPFAKQVGQLLGVDVPLFSEMHLKVAFEDTLGVVDRNTGLVILDDAQSLSWSDEERAELAGDDSTRWLTQPMPAGIHLRPEGYRGSQTVLMLWDYHSAEQFDAPVLPLPEDPFYPEVVMRGMVQLAPGLASYVDRLPHMYLDGGYYTKTAENRPLVGPTPVEGAYINAAFSGYGLMAAPAAGELLAAHILGTSLPTYERAFRLERYNDPEYRARVATWGSTGQL